MKTAVCGSSISSMSLYLSVIHLLHTYFPSPFDFKEPLIMGSFSLSLSLSFPHLIFNRFHTIKLIFKILFFILLEFINYLRLQSPKFFFFNFYLNNDTLLITLILQISHTFLPVLFVNNSTIAHENITYKSRYYSS